MLVIGITIISLSPLQNNAFRRVLPLRLLDGWHVMRLGGENEKERERKREHRIDIQSKREMYRGMEEGRKGTVHCEIRTKRRGSNLSVSITADLR